MKNLSSTKPRGGSLRRLIRNLRTGEAARVTELFRGPTPVSELLRQDLLTEEERKLARAGDNYLRSVFGKPRAK